VAQVSAARPAASLQPALLARKGGARPAMRSAQPQGGVADELDLLAASQEELGWNDHGDEPEPFPQSQAEARERRAAFTLRLDSQRHFRLRLASTLRDCSSQALVTEALDRFLDTIPQLGELASKARRPSRSA
jgi:hypothetical protein